MSGRLRAVLFDATGTLIEPAEPVGDCYARTAAAHGVVVPGWRLGDAFARVLRHAPERVYPGADPQEAARRERDWWRERVRQTFQAADSTLRFPDFDAFFADLFETYGRPTAWRLRTGATSVLRGLRERSLATGVVSNFDHRLPALLAGLGLAPLLDVVTIPARCGYAKPDARIFETALAALGVAAAEALYVGHHPERDLGAASAAGLAVVDADGLASLADLLGHIPEREIA